jgi:hypothetical protein
MAMCRFPVMLRRKKPCRKMAFSGHLNPPCAELSQVPDFLPPAAPDAIPDDELVSFNYL